MGKKRAFKPGVLRELGVYGLDSIEGGYLAGLALAEPILMVGGVGQAKTLLAERTARALGLRFCAYSAEKALFEDILGPFDPRSLYEGRLEYLRTDITIWDKQMVLIDEISRANPQMQNKWLEVIRSRRVMGKSLNELRYILAAMNPPGLLGTHPLDEALAGRFTFLLEFPDVLSMDEDDQRKVVEARSEADGPGLGTLASRALPELDLLLEEVRRRFTNVEKRLSKVTTTYVLKVAEYLDSKNIRLDGRRLGMMRRGMLALVAVNHVLGAIQDLSVFPEELYRQGLEMTLPFAATANQLPKPRIDSAHEHAASAVAGRERFLVKLSNPALAAREVVAGKGAFSEADAISTLVTKICSTLEKSSRKETAVQAAAGLLILTTKQEVLMRIRPEARHRLLACWRELCFLSPDKQAQFVDESSALQLESRLDDAALSMALRCAFSLATRLERVITMSCEYEEIAHLLVDELENGGV